jgi:hypothetical protein
VICSCEGVRDAQFVAEHLPDCGGKLGTSIRCEKRRHTKSGTQVEMKASAQVKADMPLRGAVSSHPLLRSHHGEEVGMPVISSRKRAHNVHVNVAEPAARYWTWLHRGSGLRSDPLQQL